MAMAGEVSASTLPAKLKCSGSNNPESRLTPMTGPVSSSNRAVVKGTIPDQSGAGHDVAVVGVGLAVGAPGLNSIHRERCTPSGRHPGCRGGGTWL